MTLRDPNLSQAEQATVTNLLRSSRGTLTEGHAWRHYNGHSHRDHSGTITVKAFMPAFLVLLILLTRKQILTSA